MQDDPNEFPHVPLLISIVLHCSKKSISSGN
jgi:hypothetical protein